MGFYGSMAGVYSPGKTRKKRNNKQEGFLDYKAVEHARTNESTRKVDAAFTTGNFVQAGPPTNPYTAPQYSRIHNICQLHAFGQMKRTVLEYLASTIFL